MLTNAEIKAAKPKEKNYKLTDSGGLYLLVITGKGKYWRLDYRFAGKRKTLALGIYPGVSLLDARELRESARKQIANHIDPSVFKKAAMLRHEQEPENTFEAVARAWVKFVGYAWTKDYQNRIIRRFEIDIFPHIGNSPIGTITASELLAALRKVETRGKYNTTHRILGDAINVFKYAIATDKAIRNIASDLSGTLKPAKTKHFAAITKPQGVGQLLRDIDNVDGFYTTKWALQLSPLVFVRPGELRNAEWAEIDLDKAEWNIPAEKMKMENAHLVPLSQQAIEILREAQSHNGAGKYVFPSVRTKVRPMSNNTVNVAIRRLGYGKTEMTGHGFRAMARTILDEELGVRPDIIEHQLAHAVIDPNGRAYNRTTHLVERRKMMQQWADYLDTLKAGAEIIQLRA